MNELHAHYRTLLGLDEHWEVEEVDLLVHENRIVIRLRHVAEKLTCPECQSACSQADARKRTWKHLDTMQFETLIKANVPRANCKQCGVKTVAIPWAGKHSRFTLMFEAIAIKVLLAARSVSAGAELLRVSWKTAHRIMKDAVDRGLERREEEPINYLGIDEKSFGRGQDYISMMVDIDHSRVLEVAKDRSAESCDKLFESLSEKQKAGVKAVATDFWQAFRNSIQVQVPEADIVYDHFHVSQYLGDAVDRVRKAENKRLNADGDKSLTGKRQLLLYNLDNLNREQRTQLDQIRRSALKTARAWSLKEMFRKFWEYHSESWAQKFFQKWYSWASRCRLKPMKQVAVMLKKHLGGLLAYFRHPITNSKNEGFNGRVQSIKAAAKGFRNFENYRIRILFYCGKLQLMPKPTH